MKIAIFGAGAIGGLLGARLAIAGEAVTFVARNRNLAAIRERGFTLIEADGTERHAPTATAVQDTVEAGPQDAVLLTVKAHQVVDILPQLPPLLGPETCVVTMINGLPWWYFHALAGPHAGRRLESVDPGGRIAATIDPARVIGSVVYPAAELEAPGVVRHIEGSRFTLGEPDGSKSPRAEALSRALMNAGFKSPVTKDIRGEIWVKLWGNLAFNPISALTHATLEAVCRDAGGRAAAEAMMREGQAVGEALGVEFRIALDKRIAGAEAIGAHKTSMLQDIEAGRPIELAAVLGSVVELGEIVGVPTPALRLVHGLTALLASTLSVSRSRLAPQPAA